MSTGRRTALASLAAAVGLAVAKVAVGLATGSLGILAEAVHSGVDAASALLTLYAVGVSERPADPEHQYGHGKAQHLSALAEGVFLAATAAFIGYEALMRLSTGGHPVDPTWYAFALMGVVLVVDAGRYTASRRAGSREHSSALMANALHFASDFAGTLAVLVGLALVRDGVAGADSVAAVLVAAIVLGAAGRLARRNADALMDRAPSGAAGRVERVVRSVAGVTGVRSVRVREAGGESFADVVIGISRLDGLERSHQVMDRVEQAVAAELGRATVTVHAEPDSVAERANDRVAAAALRVPQVVETHNITVLEDAGGRAITLHVRLPEALSLAMARPIVERLKDEIRREFGAVRVYAHVEPSDPDSHPARNVVAAEPELHRTATEAVMRAGAAAREVVLYRQGDRLLVVTAVRAPEGTSVRDGHALASRVEDSLREAIPELD
ncbi:MAG TPA: cation diffusion facilitator family transporter, partial [Gaiellales bacterium]|nr:cation diffusion facilitator family transporter [Gaiellales bacterium]